MSNNFTYYSPTKVYFGKNVELQTGKEIRKLGASKVLIVYGGQSAARSGLLDILRRSLETEDPAYTQSLPDYQTESGCVDIMMHTMERYFTNGGNAVISCPTSWSMSWAVCLM